MDQTQDRRVSWRRVFGPFPILVISILVLLLVSFIPLVTSSRGPRRNPLMHDVKNVGLATHNFLSAHEGHFPPLVPGSESNPAIKWPISFLTSLLPYVDHAEVYEAIDTQIPWDDPANREAYGTKIGVFASPYFDDDKTASGHAIAHLSPNARILYMRQPVHIEEVTDGYSETILIGGIDASAPPAWGDPANARDPAQGFAGGPQALGGVPHGGAAVVFVDGRARILSPEIDPQVARALATPNVGETISESEF